MRLLTAVMCAVGVCATVAPAFASFSGLLIIPTTDLVPTGEYSVEYQSDASTPQGRQDLHLINTEFGLSDRTEAGLDFDLTGRSENRFLPNAKYVFFGNAHEGVSAAVGIYTVQSQIVSAPYVVTGLDMRALRVFAGVQRASGETNWFVGVDKALSHMWTLQADYTQGAPNFATFAVVYGFDSRFSATVGIEFPNVRGLAKYSTHLTYTAPWDR